MSVLHCCIHCCCLKQILISRMRTWSQIMKHVLYVFVNRNIFEQLNSLWTVYFFQKSRRPYRPKWKHKHINTWWLMHTKGNKRKQNRNLTWKVITSFNITLNITIIALWTHFLDIILYYILEEHISFQYISIFSKLDSRDRDFSCVRWTYIDMYYFIFRIWSFIKETCLHRLGARQTLAHPLKQHLATPGQS